MEERITKMKSVTCDTTEPTTPAAVLKVAVNAVPSDCRMVAAEGTLGFCYYPDPEKSAEPGVAAYRAAMGH